MLRLWVQTLKHRAGLFSAIRSSKEFLSWLVSFRSLRLSIFISIFFPVFFRSSLILPFSSLVLLSFFPFLPVACSLYARQYCAKLCNRSMTTGNNAFTLSLIKFWKCKMASSSLNSR